jgi:hypothetical protein
MLISKHLNFSEHSSTINGQHQIETTMTDPTQLH